MQRISLLAVTLVFFCIIESSCVTTETTSNNPNGLLKKDADRIETMEMIAKTLNAEYIKLADNISSGKVTRQDILDLGLRPMENNAIITCDGKRYIVPYNFSTTSETVDVYELIYGGKYEVKISSKRSAKEQALEFLKETQSLKIWAFGFGDCIKKGNSILHPFKKAKAEHKYDSTLRILFDGQKPIAVKYRGKTTVNYEEIQDLLKFARPIGNLGKKAITGL